MTALRLVFLGALLRALKILRPVTDQGFAHHLLGGRPIKYISHVDSETGRRAGAPFPFGQPVGLAAARSMRIRMPAPAITSPPMRATKTPISGVISVEPPS